MSRNLRYLISDILNCERDGEDALVLFLVLVLRKVESV